MKRLLFVVCLFVSMSLMCYEVGSAPWCSIDDYGNKTCMYYSYSSCMNAVSYGPGVMCVPR